MNPIAYLAVPLGWVYEQPVPMPRKLLSVSLARLQEMYEEEELSMGVIARLIQSSTYVVRMRLLEMGVQPRPSSRPTDLTFDRRLLVWLDGLLLGDGCVRKQKRGLTPYFSLCQRTDRVPWLDEMENRFNEAGLGCMQTPYSKITRGKVCTGVLLTTHACTAFHAVRDRWYPQGKKIVPRDLRLTDEMLAQWYWGDGSLDRKNSVKLCTNGFEMDDAQFLAAQLERWKGWAVIPQRTSTGPVLNLYRQQQVVEFLDVVRPFVPSCFIYKTEWRHARARSA